MPLTFDATVGALPQLLSGRRGVTRVVRPRPAQGRHGSSQENQLSSEV